MKAAQTALPVAVKFGAGIFDTIKGVGRGMVERAAAAPSASVAADLALGGAAGVGGGAAKEAGVGTTGQMGAEIGSALTAQGAAKAVTKGVVGLTIKGGKFLFNRMRSGASRAESEKFVEGLLGEHMTGVARKNIAEGAAISKEIPGLSPTLSGATKSRAIANEQRSIESRLFGEQLETAVARHAANEAAIGNYTKNSGFNAPPEAIIESLSKRIGRQLVWPTAGRSQATVLQKRVADALPTADKAAEGAALRGKEISLRSEASDSMSKRAKELGILDDDLTSQFRQLTDDITARYSGFQTRRKPPEDILGFMKADVESTKQGAKYTFADFKNFRELLGLELRSAMSGAKPDVSRARELREMVKSVDNILDGLASKNAQYKQFRDDYRTGYIQRFDEGPAFKTRQLNGRNFYTTTDEKVQGLYFAPGDVSAAKQFNRVFAGDAGAQENLVSHALDSLRNKTVKNGIIDPAKLRDWISKHRSVMDELPFVRDKVASIESATEALAARQAQLLERQETVGRSYIAKLSGMDPDKAVKNAMATPAKMKSLMGAMDRDGKVAVRKIMWEKASDGTGTQITKFLDDNAAVLSEMYTPAHLKKLRIIAEARIRQEMVPEPGGRGIQVDILKSIEEKTGMGLSSSVSRFYAYVSGRLSRSYLMAEAAGRLLQGRSRIHTAALLKEAIYDEKVALHMANSVQFGKESKTASQIFNAALFRLGLPIVAPSAAVMTSPGEE
jgi:hypothetical protein